MTRDEYEQQIRCRKREFQKDWSASCESWKAFVDKYRAVRSRLDLDADTPAGALFRGMQGDDFRAELQKMDALRRKWPGFNPFRPTEPEPRICFIGRSIRIGEDGRPVEKPHFVTMQIPTDATESEVVSALRAWRRAFDRHFPQTKKRTHKGELAFRLQVFDHYTELRNFAQVAVRLKATESNVRRAYARVYQEIFGAPLPTQTKGRRAAGFDPDAHEKSCQCLQRARTFEELCPAARAFVEQDTRASVGIQTATGTPEGKVTKGRKRPKPATDAQFQARRFADE